MLTWAAKDGLIEKLRLKLKEQIDVNNELLQIIYSLNKTIEGLNQTIKELTEKLNKNSRNSSKPPSSDGLKKPSPKSLRKPSGKKAGGQFGHPGANLPIINEPDETVQHMPPECLICPNHDTCKSRAEIGEIRQVIDAVVIVKCKAHRSAILS